MVASTLVETGVLLLPTLVVAPVAALLAPGLRSSALPLAATAVVAAAVLALPAVIGARRWESVRQNASGRRSAAVRVGGELVVAAGAGLALWQLRRQGGATTVQDGGLLDRVDLVVVAAPVLGLLAGALLAARLVQPVSALAARALARRPGLAALVAAWQTARAPGPYAVVVLLVVVLVGTGVLVTGAASTRSAEISRVAAEQVGADVRVGTDRPVGANLTESARQAAALVEVEGVEVVTGVLVEPASTAAGPVQVVAYTADPVAPDADAPSTVRAGGDLRATWDLVVSATADLPSGLHPDDLPAPAAGLLVVSASTWWVAASGYPLRLDLGSVAVTSILDEAVTTGRTTDLVLPPPPGGPDDSWRLVGLDAEVSGLGTAATGVEVSLTGLNGPDGPIATAGTWWAQGVTTTAEALPGDRPGLRLRSELFARPSATGRVLAAEVATVTAAAVPARVGRDLLSASGAAVGDPLLVRRVQALSTEVVGSVDGAAGVEGDVVVVDQRTLALVDLATGRNPSAPGQWEVALRGGSGSAARAAASERVREAALGTGLPVRVVDREQLEDELATDPLSSGALRTGMVGGAVAAVLALVGLLASGAVSARDRLHHDTVLAVLGADARQQRRAEAVRTLLVGALAVVAGLVTGWGVLVLTGPALVGDPTALGRPAGVPAQVSTGAVAAVAVLGGLLAAVPLLVRDPAARSTLAARMRVEEAP